VDEALPVSIEYLAVDLFAGDRMLEVIGYIPDMIRVRMKSRGWGFSVRETHPANQWQVQPAIFDGGTESVVPV
jgi:hypothetical protein